MYVSARVTLEVGDTKVAHVALILERAKRTCDFVGVHQVVFAVEQKEVDVAGVQHTHIYGSGRVLNGQVDKLTSSRT